MEIEEKDIQKRILETIKGQLKNDEKLSQVLMDTLFLSQDAIYRRMRGEVPLTIYETKTLCEAYNISFDEYGSYREGQVNFIYKPLGDIGLDFVNYMEGIRDGLRELKSLKNVRIIMSVNNTQLFQLFNLPHLTRFKYFFWGKTHLNLPQFANKKFKREKIHKKLLSLGIEAHNIYNSITTHEIYGPETLRGTLRQIEYYFDAHLFEDPAYAVELIDNVLELLTHMKRQAELGLKFARGNRPPGSGNDFHLYASDMSIPDSTILIKWDEGTSLYLAHNVMNYLFTTDPYYVSESEGILERLMNNSSPISGRNEKERNRFFAKIEQNALKFKRKIEMELEI